MKIKYYSVISLCFFLGACSVGPNYVTPKMHIAKNFTKKVWKVANPQPIEGEWWKIYHDEELNALMQKVNLSNLTIAKYEASYKQALGALQSSKAGYFPTLSLAPSSSVSKSAYNTSSGSQKGTFHSNSVPLQASWTPDIWGSVRRLNEANDASLQASKADVAAAKLSVQALLAQSYFQLRAYDSELIFFEEMIKTYQSSFEIIRYQHSMGIASKIDLNNAQSQLNSIISEQATLKIQRALLEHSIAVLVSDSPSEFTIKQEPINVSAPNIPLSVPSELLQRRPDIIASQRRVKQANALIGVAESAWFPSLSLTASTGYQSNTLTNLLSEPNLIWSLGGAVSASIFDGGLRAGEVKQAKAQYEASVVNYKQTVLSAFQEVEDDLAALVNLEDESAVEEENIKISKESLDMTQNQYEEGIVSRLVLNSAKITYLMDQDSKTQTLSNQMVSSVSLISALGGGWSEDAKKLDHSLT